MADQAMYHQGDQSVFVGGRLWTLLPPPAVEMDWKFFIYSDVSHTHTHPARRGFFRKNAKLSKMSETKADAARYIHMGQAALLNSRRASAR